MYNGASGPQNACTTTDLSAKTVWSTANKRLLMKFGTYVIGGMSAMALALSAVALASSDGARTDNASPIYGVTIPDGYRKWEMIAPAEEAAPLNELRAVLGNPAAVEAVNKATLPFPDGTIFVKLAWKRVPSAEFGPASVPGASTTVQVMVKDSKKYASTASRTLCRSSSQVSAWVITPSPSDSATKPPSAS